MCEWVFDGIGTELIGLAIGILLGGTAGYSIGVKSKAKQRQKAGDGAKQEQIYTIGMKAGEENNPKINAKASQLQVAGDNAIQTQVGGVRNA